MAFCISCGKELSNDAKFCANCGKAVDSEKTEQRKTVYEGQLHKCPNCGELLEAFVTICPTCNYELRGAHVTSRVHELAQKLEKITSIDEKNDIISNFYIPNTKEDIYEFFILAVSNITSDGDCSDAWSAKLEQAYLKAKLAFGDSKEFTNIEELYNKTKRDTNKSKTKKKTSSSLILLGVFMIILGIALFLFCDDFFIFMIPLCLVGIVLIPIGFWGRSDSRKRRR